MAGLSKSRIREAYRYLSMFLKYEEIDGKKVPMPVFVQGFFGAGKTDATLLVAWLIDVRRPIDKIIILSFPLRALRDDKYYRLIQWGAKPFLLKAHDEVCNDLRQCVENVKKTKGRITRSDYFKCLEQHLKRGNCAYKHHINDMKDYVKAGGRIIVATHLMSRIPKLIFGDSKLIVDEAEDYLLKLSEPIPRSELDIISDKKIKSRIKQYFELYRDDLGREYYVIKKEGLRILFARDAVYISATIPPSFIEYFHKLSASMYMSKKKRGKIRRTIPPLDPDLRTLRSSHDNDILLILNERLVWRQRQEWYPEIFSEILKIAKLSIRKYGVLGVLSRNKEMTKDLINLFKSSGFSVWSDLQYDPSKSRDVYTRADIIILTVRGPLYRGRSVFSAKRLEICKEECKDKEKCYEECQKDFPVVVGFYQAKRDKIHPYLSESLIRIGGEELYRDFRTELLHARNLQALYRFNRERDKQHIMILLDQRFAEAYELYYRRRFKKEMKVLWVYDRTKIFDVFSSIVPK